MNNFMSVKSEAWMKQTKSLRHKLPKITQEKYR